MRVEHAKFRQRKAKKPLQRSRWQWRSERFRPFRLHKVAGDVHTYCIPDLLLDANSSRIIPNTGGLWTLRRKQVPSSITPNKRPRETSGPTNFQTRKKSFVIIYTVHKSTRMPTISAQKISGICCPNKSLTIASISQTPRKELQAIKVQNSTKGSLIIIVRYILMNANIRVSCHRTPKKGVIHTIPSPERRSRHAS